MIEEIITAPVEMVFIVYVVKNMVNAICLLNSSVAKIIINTEEGASPT